MRKRARLIYNPTSGNEGLKRFVPDILNIMEQAGYESSAFQTTPKPFSRVKKQSGLLKPALSSLWQQAAMGRSMKLSMGLRQPKSGLKWRLSLPVQRMIMRGHCGFPVMIRLKRHGLF